MKTLGDELISNDAVAVIELVKNAYDADAGRVLIKFVGPLVAGQGRVEVFDDGSGMTIDIVRGAWMEPATPGKRQTIKSGRKSRRVLGEKGIGRFAALRLASELELITRAQETEDEVYAFFDWTQFENEKRYLDEVLILTDERVPEVIRSDVGLDALWPATDAPDYYPPSNQGTLLRMSKLSRSWDIERFRQIQRGLARMVSPFLDAPDFRVYLQVPEEFEEISSEIGPPAILKYPHYSVRGEVDSDGLCNLTLCVEATMEAKPFTDGFVRNEKGHLQRLGFDEYFKLKESVESSSKDGMTIWKSKLSMCGPLKIEFRVWDRDELGNVMQQTGSSLKMVREDLDAIAGVNIYRDGFRVFPYGEPNNDWLRLDIRRVQNPTKRLSNNQIVGYISISADQNKGLKDQSNREGLDENQSFSDLREIMFAVLSEIEDVRKRSKTPPPGSSPDSSTISLFAPLDLTQIRAHLDKLNPKDAVAKNLINDVERAFNRQVEGLKTTVAKYHALATLGQLIDVLLHDGRQPLAKIRKETVLAREDILEGLLTGEGLLTKLVDRLRIMEGQSDVLATVFRRIEPFGGRKRGRPKQLYLEKIVEDSFGVFSSQIADLNVATSLPSSETLVRVDEAEMQEVLVNLLQNSLYWLQFVESSKRQISISVARSAQDHVEIVFADSGPGIPEANRSRIFEPYFSTKKDGVGLGLAIAGEIVNDYYGGKLELMDAGTTGGAIFRITLKKRI